MTGPTSPAAAAAPTPAPLSPAAPRRATVLVATDGGALAANAARVAAALADAGGHAVAAVHVVDARSASVPPPVDLGIALADALIGPGVHAEQEREVRAALGRAVGRAVDWPVRVAFGRPAAAIGAEAARAGAALVVVGLARHGRLARLTQDETVVGLARELARPVLAAAPTLGGAPRHALAAVDFGRASLRAARAALGLLAPGGTLTLAYAPPPRTYDPDEEGEQLVHELGADAAFDWFERALGTGAERAARVERVVLRGRQPCPAATLLLAHAEAAGADLLALGSRRHGRLERLLLGSATADALRDGRVSVLAVPPAEADDVVLPGSRATAVVYGPAS